MTVTYAYLGDIVKTDKDPDGDLFVYGKATGPDLDLDEQRCDPTWLKTAMPAWAQWANVREQHSAIAAGVGVETVADGDDWFVKSLVVDEGSKRKVEKGVLKGYSVGIRNARVVKDATAPGGRIVAGDIVELSLVDRPCNPTATMAIAKSADGALNPVDQAGELLMDLTKAVIVDQPATVVEPETPLVKQAPAFDRGKSLATAGLILAGITKGIDNSSDIAGGYAVIQQLAELIVSEANSLAQGNLDEEADLQCLMVAVCALKQFICNEKAQDDSNMTTDDDDDSTSMDGQITYAGLAAEPDITKAKYTAQQQRDMLSAGHAIKNPAGEPSYPIGDKEDLQNAIHAVGRGSGDHDAIRRHIIRSAKRLGASSMIPDNWNADGSTDDGKTAQPDQKNKHKKNKSVTPDATAVTKAAAYEKRIETLEAELAKVLATPIPGGPVLITAPKPVKPASTSKAAYYREQAARASDPAVSNAYLDAARKVETAEATAH